MKRVTCARCLAAWATLWLGLASAVAEPPLPTLNARPAPLAENINIGDRVEHIRFHGMLSIPNVYVNGLRFAQLSGLAWDDDDEILYAISDKGALFHLRPIFRDGALIDLRLVAAVPLLGVKSERRPRGALVDSEGLDIVNGRNGRRGDAELVVSFERTPRIARYRTNGQVLAEQPLPPPLGDTDAYRDDNRMLEAVCMDPLLGMLTMPEAPLTADPAGFNRIYANTGRHWVYPMENKNRIVALECLGNGEVLVLERDYGRLLWRSLISLKRVRLLAAGSKAPVPVEPLVTLDTSKGFQIDNFEGLTRHRGNRFLLVSDNNELFVQRTLLLYIELLKD